MAESSRTQVAIIGAGPCGLLLGQLLTRYGIDNIILERRSAEYVAGRIRAGVLESPTIAALKEAGVGDGPDNEGVRMHGVNLRWGDGERCRIDFGLANKHATVYGQTRVTHDLMAARKELGGVTIYHADNVEPHAFDTEKPHVTYRHGGREYRLDCDFICGCDGFHGISRQSLPQDRIEAYEFGFPFGWLGLLADVPPVGDEVSWINHVNGFVMCSLRSKTRSRFYLQVPEGEKADNWTADRFWEELSSRLPDDLDARLTTGPALEMSVTPLTSYVCTTMQYGRMYLAGDAVHNVPPTGAKGLNLAIADASHLAHAMREHYVDHSTAALDNYGQKALHRTWKAVRFSWWMTNLTHGLTHGPFERKMQIAELEYTKYSQAAQTAIAENFCGLDRDHAD